MMMKTKTILNVGAKVWYRSAALDSWQRGTITEVVLTSDSSTPLEYRVRLDYGGTVATAAVASSSETVPTLIRTSDHEDDVEAAIEDLLRIGRLAIDFSSGTLGMMMAPAADNSSSSDDRLSYQLTDRMCVHLGRALNNAKARVEAIRLEGDCVGHCGRDAVLALTCGLSACPSLLELSLAFRWNEDEDDENEKTLWHLDCFSQCVGRIRTLTTLHLSHTLPSPEILEAALGSTMSLRNLVLADCDRRVSATHRKTAYALEGGLQRNRSLGSVCLRDCSADVAAHCLQGLSDHISLKSLDLKRQKLTSLSALKSLVRLLDSSVRLRDLRLPGRVYQGNLGGEFVVSAETQQRLILDGLSCMSTLTKLNIHLLRLADLECLVTALRSSGKCLDALVLSWGNGQDNDTRDREGRERRRERRRDDIGVALYMKDRLSPLKALRHVDLTGGEGSSSSFRPAHDTVFWAFFAGMCLNLPWFERLTGIEQHASVVKEAEAVMASKRRWNRYCAKVVLAANQQDEQSCTAVLPAYLWPAALAGLARLEMADRMHHVLRNCCNLMMDGSNQHH